MPRGWNGLGATPIVMSIENTVSSRGFSMRMLEALPIDVLDFRSLREYPS